MLRLIEYAVEKQFGLTFLSEAMEKQPALGYGVAAPPAVTGGLKVWQGMDAMVGSLGLLVGLVVGVLTAMVQYENWLRRRRERLERMDEEGEG